MNANQVLNRIKLLMGFKTDLELANYLGVKRTVIAQWRRRGSIGDWELIFQKIPDIDLNWLIYGEKLKAKRTNKPKKESSAVITNFFMEQGIKESKPPYSDYNEKIKNIAGKLSKIDQYRLLKIAEVLLEIEKEIE